MSRSEMYMDPEVFDWLGGDLVSPLDEERERPLLDIVAEMPSPMRDIVELVGFGQYSKAEAARTLNLSVPWVHKLWARAKEQLGEHL